MSQYVFPNLVPETTGLQLADALNQWTAAIDSGRIGSARPTNAVQGMEWWKLVSSSLAEKYIFDGANDVLIGTLDITAHTWTPVIFDGTIVTSKIADANITTAKIADGGITTAKIADANVTATKIADGAVVDTKLASNSVTTAKIADANVTTAKVADSNITTAKIANAAVTGAKLANGSVSGAIIADGGVPLVKLPSISANRLLGDTSGTGGAVGSVSLGPSLAMSAGALQLKNDTASPGNLAYYGTDNSGASGYFPLPLLKTYVATYQSNADITTIIPLDNTLPQSSEGVQIISLNVSVPAGISLAARVHFSAFGTANGSIPIVASIRQGTGVVGTAVSQPGSSGQLVPIVLDAIDFPPSGTVTYTVRIGPGTAGTVRLNGNLSGALFNSAAAVLTVTLMPQ